MSELRQIERRRSAESAAIAGDVCSVLPIASFALIRSVPSPVETDAIISAWFADPRNR
jgi:hypothetical protein